MNLIQILNIALPRHFYIPVLIVCKWTSNVEYVEQFLFGKQQALSIPGKPFVSAVKTSQMILYLGKHKFWSSHFELLQLLPVQTINAVTMGFARAMTQPSSDVNVITILVSRMVFVSVSLPFLFLFLPLFSPDNCYNLRGCGILRELQ